MSAEKTSSVDTVTRGQQLTAYIAGARKRQFPPEIIDAAKRALVDFAGVGIGAADQPVTGAVRRVAEAWAAPGKAHMFLGGTTLPMIAVLVNGTMVHAMDYDDTHPGGCGHPSGPCWSTALALAEQHGFDEKIALAGFITGFDVMSKLGGGGPPGVGRSLQRRGLHPTSVVGRAGAAAVASAMFGYDEHKIANALGIAATTAGGLVGSFGTDSKPFHAGKAAMDGILAAQLAGEGFEAATHLYELRGGLLDAFIQDREVEVPLLDFETKWELLTNGFKPYACCRATHASTQAARTLAEQVGSKRVTRVHAKVHPNALVTAGKRNPRTALEGKFSVPFCIALGLRGYRAVYTDFVDATMQDAKVMEIVPVVELEAIHGQAPHSAHLDVYLEGGEHLHADTAIVTGHPDNPMSWDDLYVKFSGLVEPVLGTATGDAIFDCLRNFDRPGSLANAMPLLATVPRIKSPLRAGKAA